MLIEMGRTWVLCNVSVEEEVPEWLVGKGRGWLTASYALLPRSTHTRTGRETDGIGGRTQEVRRLIEVQGTAEGEPFSREALTRMLDLAKGGIDHIIDLQQDALASYARASARL